MVRIRWRRRSVFAGALLPALAVALMPAGDVPPSSERGPSMPDRMAGYSHLTADVSSSPPGRGVALFQFGFGVEFLDFPQAVLVGADGDVYRRVDLAEERAGAGGQGDPAPMLLSPDGTRVAVGAHDAEQPELAILDLATGDVEEHPVPDGRSLLPVAWSPDGRRLAYLFNSGATNPYAGTGPIAGDVGLLDLASGAAAPLDGAEDVRTVAFAPDGQELAVQRAGGALDVLPLDGGAIRTLAPRPGFHLAGPAAWSPDGSLIVVWRTSSTCPGLHTNPSPACAADEVLSFVDATGRSAAPPAPLTRGVVGPGWVLGWRAADRLAVLVPEPVTDANNPEEHRVIDVPLDGGEPRQLSALPTSGANYAVSRFHVATGLLPELEVREAGEPDRGRWPVWLRLGAAFAVAAGAAGTASLVTRRAAGAVA